MITRNSDCEPDHGKAWLNTLLQLLALVIERVTAISPPSTALPPEAQSRDAARFS